jgi:methionyl aminopeptidase
VSAARRETSARLVHSPAEVAGIRTAARITARVLEELCGAVHAGMTTLLVDQMGGERIRAHGGESAFFGYRGFPGQVCVSLNDEVVHGIGRADRVIRPGDLLKIDVGVRCNGFYGDAARTVCVDAPASDEGRRLTDAAWEALAAGMDAARAGRDVTDIGRAVERCVKRAGFSVVRDFVGHAVGCALHEPLEVPNFDLRPRGQLLKPGMVLAIEPMINAGDYRVRVDADGWTVRTADGRLSAHVEQTVLITEGEAEILTWPKMPSGSTV